MIIIVLVLIDWRGVVVLVFVWAGKLQNGSEWHQDCLAHLLKLLCQLGVPLEDRHSLELFDSFGIASLLPTTGKPKRRRYNKHEKLVIPPLNKVPCVRINSNLL